MPHARFIEGPAGVGKTTYAVSTIGSMLADGIHPEQVLVLLPQRTLGQPYADMLTSFEWPAGSPVDIVTIGGLARRGIEKFWPLIVEEAGFGKPTREPTFLTIETTQYFMERFVQNAVSTGAFDSVSLRPNRIMSQSLDNLTKAAINQFTLEEVEDRLIAAWGDRRSNRPPVYRASIDLARQFREHCLQENLLDFSLQVDIFMRHLLPSPAYQKHFRQQYHHLVADNLEENFPIVADLIRWMWDDLDTALLLYDEDAGYRVFLGADPAGMHALRELCDPQNVEQWDQNQVTSPGIQFVEQELDRFLSEAAYQPGHSAADGVERPTEPAFDFAAYSFYPQMIAGVVNQVAELIDSGVPPREIVILAPFLGDALRFSLMTQFEERGIPAVSHRPSRAVRDEPAARAVLTLMALAHPNWGIAPPRMDVADALQQSIDGLDPVRASLLARIVYRPGQLELTDFDAINSAMQERITFRAGERYQKLGAWLSAYQAQEQADSPDVFLSRLFGELLSQADFGFHKDLEAGRVVAELVESARKFRQTFYIDDDLNWSEVSHEYYRLVQDGLLAALYTASWRDEEKDAVFIAPAYTFLMRNRWADYQFWLDIGSGLWWERLEQPLTHPYVLTRNFPAGDIWTDQLEHQSRRESLRRLTLGLTRRCRKHIRAEIANFGEQGYEQRGPLLRFVQQLTPSNRAERPGVES